MMTKFALDRFNNDDFDRGSTRLVEAAWWLVRAIVFDHRIPVPSRLKVSLLRLFGAKIGRGVVIRSRVIVTFPWRLELGDFVWLGDEVLLLNLDRISIGSHVCVSQRALLCTGSHEYNKPGFDLVTAPIVVGDHCWIGAMVFVGPGVTIETQSVCAAASVVVKDVGHQALVAGNPARVVRRIDGASAVESLESHSEA
jgi:putative colanic acid biosynthesis acetyltransferase WcaF